MSTDELNRSDIKDPLAFLLDAEVEIDGRMPWSSNATFLATLRTDDVEQKAIYKPVKGERPLWDFEQGLHRRERAAFLLSEHLGIGAVPPTVLRDGPYGEGSFQWFVDADHSEHYFTIFEKHTALHDQFRNIAVFDVVANNTDRKSGHCLLAGDKIWAIDHGLCFSASYKLRTVIWEFADDSIDDPILERVAKIAERVPIDIAALLSEDEIDAMQLRATKLVMERRFPVDHSGRQYPWPLV